MLALIVYNGATSTLLDAVVVLRKDEAEIAAGGTV